MNYEFWGFILALVLAYTGLCFFLFKLSHALELKKLHKKIEDLEKENGIYETYFSFKKLKQKKKNKDSP